MKNWILPFGLLVTALSQGQSWNRLIASRKSGISQILKPMKIHRHVASGILAALVLACPASRTQAQTIITNTFTFTFANGGATSDFNSTWLYYYNSSGYNYPMMLSLIHI